MVKFISISSGSCGNCYYLEHNGYGLIIDMGISHRAFRRAFSNFGLPIASINAILLTHDHTDHVKSVGVLSREFRIPVYTSQKVHDSVMRNHFVSKKIPLDLQKSVDWHAPFQLGPFTVETFVVPHDSADNNGYIIRVDGKCFVLITDVGHFTDEMPVIVHEATHLIIESNYDEQMLLCGRYPQRLKNRISSGSGHISNHQTAEFLAQNLDPDKIHRIWLCHLSAENNQPAVAYATCAERLANSGYRLEGDDANLILQVLPRKTPTLLMELE